MWKKPFLPGNSQITTSKVNCKMTVTSNVAITVFPNGLLLTQSQRFLQFSQLISKSLWETSWSAHYSFDVIRCWQQREPTPRAQARLGEIMPPHLKSSLCAFLGPQWEKKCFLLLSLLQENPAVVGQNIPPQTLLQLNWPCDPMRWRQMSVGQSSRESFDFPHKKGQT